jgi:L,D-transpeptidase ErfK/SrfK
MFFFHFFLFLFLHFGASAEEIENEYYQIKKGETFHQIAINFNLGVDEILRANPQIVDPNKIYFGQKIILPIAHLLPNTKRIGIVINLAELRLYFFKDGEVSTYPISIGKDEKTPTGLTKIIAKKEDPTWIPPQSIREENPDLPEIVPPGPENPLGSHALYLDGSRNPRFTRIVIHGTNAPWKIGSEISHGCIRMYPENVAKLFAEAEIGTRVLVINQPLKIHQYEAEVYLESHLKEVPEFPIKDGEHAKLICKRIKNCEEKVDWEKVEKALMQNLGIPIKVTKSTD